MDTQTVVIKTEKHLNLQNSHQLKTDLLDALNRGTKRVQIDFSETESIDSAGLGKVLLFNEKFKENGGDFEIVNVRHKEVIELFNLLELDKIVKIQYSN